MFKINADGHPEFEPIRVNILDEDLIEQIKECMAEAPVVRSHINKGSNEETYVDIARNGDPDNQYTSILDDQLGRRDIRKSKNYVVTTAMLDDINYEFEHKWADAGYKVIDTNLLRYDEGDWLRPHSDTYVLDTDTGHTERKITTITMVNKAPDLEGGELVVYPDRNDLSKSWVISLDIGETCFFPSHLLHECREIKKGFREVLVSWMA